MIKGKGFMLTDLNYVEDSAGGPDVTVGILPKLDKVTLLQVLIQIFSFNNYSFSLSLRFCVPVYAYVHDLNNDCTLQEELLAYYKEL